MITNFLIPVTVNTLPQISELEGKQGMFVLPDGSININRKDGTWMVINKQSDHAGTLVPSANPSTTAGVAKWYWAKAGTYTNLGGFTLSKSGIVSYNGSTWSSLELDFPEPMKYIQQFADLNFPVTNPSVGEKVQCVDNFIIYQLLDGKTSTSSDLPSTSPTIWKSLGGSSDLEEKVNMLWNNDKLNSNPNTYDEFDYTSVDFTTTGLVLSNGSFNGSTAWKRTGYIDYLAGDEITVHCYGNDSHPIIALFDNSNVFQSSINFPSTGYTTSLYTATFTATTDGRMVVNNCIFYTSNSNYTIKIVRTLPTGGKIYLEYDEFLDFKVLTPDIIPTDYQELSENKYYSELLTANKTVNFNLATGAKVEIYAEGNYTLTINGFAINASGGITLVLKNTGINYVLYASDGTQEIVASGTPLYYRILGVDQNITFANNNDFAFAGSFSVSVSVKLLNNTSNFYMGLSNGANRVWDLAAKGLGSDLIFDAQQAASTNIYTATGGVSVNDEYRVTYTFTLNTIKIYINGNLSAQITSTPTATRGSGNLFVGKFASYQSLNSKIRDLVIVNKELTATEVAEDYSKLDKTTLSYYASNVVSFHKLNGILTDAKGTHNGISTTPLYL